MKKALAAIVGVVCLIAITFSACSDSRKSNDDAQRDKDGRYLTIVNDTAQIINKVYVIVGEGTEIESMEQTNPDEKSFSIEIPKAYADFTTFTVVLIDRYDLKYAKEVTNVPATGRTEVVITESNYVEEKGDFWDKLDKWMNGD